jgi:hypothetical protein
LLVVLYGYDNWSLCEINGSQGGEYEEEEEVPCSLVGVDRRFKDAYCEITWRCIAEGPHLQVVSYFGRATCIEDENE